MALMNRVSKFLDHLESAESKSSSSPSSSHILQPSPCADFLLRNNSGNQSGFRYTLDGFADEVLTTQERRDYEENGFLVVKGLLNEEEVSYFYQRFTDLVTKPELRPPQMTVMRDVSLAKLDRDLRTNPDQVTKLQNWSREPGLWKFCTNPRLVRYTKAWCGDNVRGMHYMVINKPADAGQLSSRHPFHQDQWYFPFGPSDHIVCAWTALEKVHRRNGCLSVVPGSHKNAPGGKLLDHDNPKDWHGPVNAAYHGIQVPDINAVMRKRVHLEMEPGDTVFFHPLLLHSSGANLTYNSRRSISCHFASSTLCEYHDFEKAGQQRIKEDVMKIAKTIKDAKFSESALRSLPYAAIWGVKSRQVCGDEGNLSVAASLKRT